MRENILQLQIEGLVARWGEGKHKILPQTKCLHMLEGKMCSTTNSEKTGRMLSLQAELLMQDIDATVEHAV